MENHFPINKKKKVINKTNKQTKDETNPDLTLIHSMNQRKVTRNSHQLIILAPSLENPPT